ncbi:MAG: hypothetical protein AB8I08_39350 [Sandaracinaceae bacterium]
MNAAANDTDRDVEQVARALSARGARVECLAMLRGAVARDGSQRSCVELLRSVVEQGPPPDIAHAEVIELGLPLVDRWIRGGMLVEALALLSGTPMGSLETGREWAQLLGELLAPVPVDAEPVLKSMHEQLLTGGASVAMSLLEDRAKETPPPAAWALRRLELLRWILLDNAAAAQDSPRLPQEVPSLLAGAIREGIHQRSLVATIEGAKAFVAQYPASADARLTLSALEGLAAEVHSQSGTAHARNRTIPVFGRPAAALQLRMCNLSNAASVYRRILEDRDDPDVAALSAHVHIVERALAGEPLDAVPPVAHVGGNDDEDLVTQLFGLAHLKATPDTSTHAGRRAPEKSGPVVIGDAGSTEQMPSAAEHVMRLVAQGRHEEAEKVRNAMMALFEDDPTERTFERPRDAPGAGSSVDDTPPDRPLAPEPTRNPRPESGAHRKVSSPRHPSGNVGRPERVAATPEGVVVQKIRPIE